MQCKHCSVVDMHFCKCVADAMCSSVVHVTIDSTE